MYIPNNVQRALAFWVDSDTYFVDIQVNRAITGFTSDLLKNLRCESVALC